MERSKAIELLKNAVPAKVLPDDEIGFFIQAVSMAIAALEGKDTNVPTKWIPVSERLPEEDYRTGENFQYSADVLMTVYNAEDEETIIDCGYTVDGRWYSDTTDCFVPSWWEVLAWMPLPEPWKGEAK